MTFPPKTFHVRVPGGRLAYHDVGESPRAILALPPPGWDASRLSALEQALGTYGRRILTLDLRGHGQSTADFDRYAAEDVAADAIAVLDHARQDEVDLIACSAAAASALRLALDHPARVHSLTLVSPRLRWTIREGLLATTLLLPISSSVRTTLWADEQRRQLASRPPAGFEASVEAARVRLEDPRRLAAATRLGIAGRTRALEGLGDLAAPTLLVFGSQDPVAANVVREAEALATAIGTPAEIALLPGLGHALEIEDPTTVADLAVSNFEREVSRAA